MMYGAVLKFGSLVLRKTDGGRKLRTWLRIFEKDVFAFTLPQGTISCSLIPRLNVVKVLAYTPENLKFHDVLLVVYVGTMNSFPA